MRNIARALLQAAAFIELAGEPPLSQDDCVKALESIAANLQDATAEECLVLASVSAELAQEHRNAGPAYAGAADFYESFMESFGIGDF